MATQAGLASRSRLWQHTMLSQSDRGPDVSSADRGDPVATPVRATPAMGPNLWKAQNGSFRYFSGEFTLFPADAGHAGYFSGLAGPRR